MQKYENIFKEISIGKLLIKNRIVMPPMVMCYANSNGEINQQVIAHFEARAKGKVGLILAEASYIDIGGKGFQSQIAINKDDLIPRLHQLTSSVKVNGAAIGIQLYHGGIQAEVENPVGPSAIGRKDFPPRSTPRELTTSEVEELVSKFGDAALRAKKAGFDLVELHGSHGYLIAQFFSPITNLRTDKYGADKIQFAREIVNDVKKKCGKNYPIIFRLAAKEFQEGGIDLERSKIIARNLENCGVDALNITGGTYDTSDYIIPPVYYDKQGFYFDIASEFKKIVDIPIISGGMISDPNYAEEAIKNNKVDMVFVGRQLIADPYWLKKIKNQTIQTIKPCIACQECVERIFFQEPVNCSVNPLKSFEYKYIQESEIQKATEVKEVMVIGGGIAGMEAARVAKIRGHNVYLYEKTSQLGGILNIIRDKKHKSRIDHLVKWYENHLDIENDNPFSIHVKTEVTPELIRTQKPEIIILATGSSPLLPSIPGVDNTIVADKVFSGDIKVGDKAVIIGGGGTGCDLAINLASEGKSITILEMCDDIATKEPIITTMGIKTLFNQLKIKVITGVVVSKIKEKEVDYFNKNGQFERMRTDSVILAAGRVPKVDEDLLITAKNVAEEVHIIGDAKEPRKILQAMNGGFWVGYGI